VSVLRARRRGPKVKSARQVRFLLSSVSPLSGAQKTKLKGELHRRTVRVKG
jgi:hypothetical protein